MSRPALEDGALINRPPPAHSRQRPFEVRDERWIQAVPVVLSPPPPRLLVTEAPEACQISIFNWQRVSCLVVDG
ncbi:unnamed protein product [Arctogadus glacialis]